MAPLPTEYGVGQLADGQVIVCTFLVNVSYIRRSLIISLTDPMAPTTTTPTLTSSNIVTLQWQATTTTTEIVTVTATFDGTVHQIIPDLYSPFTNNFFSRPNGADNYHGLFIEQPQRDTPRAGNDHDYGDSNRNSDVRWYCPFDYPRWKRSKPTFRTGCSVLACNVLARFHYIYG
jgi:hypothetical protein